MRGWWRISLELWRRLIVNIVPIACGSMDKAFRLQHTVPFRQASLFVFIARRTHEPLLTGSNVSPPPPIDISFTYRQLRARRSFMLVKDVPLRTRRVPLLYNVYGMVIVPFWFSMVDHWTALTPFWLLTNDIKILVEYSLNLIHHANHFKFSIIQFIVHKVRPTINLYICI